MKINSYTRGSGLLENFLAKKRTDKANSFILKSFRKGRVLDIGCGTYPFFLINTDFNEKYGVDPSLKLSKIKDKNLNLKVFDVTSGRLPFKDDFFDTITMLAVFEHIDNKKLNFVISQARRVLKKNGILIITTPAPWSDKILHLMAKYKLISAEEIHEHKHNYSNSKIKDIIKDAGFKKDKIRSGFFEFRLNMWFVVKK